MGNEMTPEQQAKMQRWMEVATPGEKHKALDGMVGEWSVLSKWYWEPGAPASEDVCDVSAKWIFGGRFVMTTCEGIMGGMPYEGIGYFGFDNFKQKYNGFWMDNMGTVMLTMEGDHDPATRTITMTGKSDDPTTGEKMKDWTYIITWANEDKYVFEFHDMSRSAGQTLCGELIYTRKQ